MNKLDIQNGCKIINQICAKGCSFSVRNDHVILGGNHLVTDDEIDQIKKIKDIIKYIFKRDINNLILERLHNLESILHRHGLNLHDWIGDDGLFSVDDLIDIVRGEYSDDWLAGYVNAVDFNKVAKNTKAKQCGDCIHFHKDTIGDGSGLGQCGKLGEARWPRASSKCAYYVNKRLIQKIRSTYGNQNTH